MDYNFFLFTKLHEVVFKPETEYDRLFDELIPLYEEWEEWDLKNASDVGTYESILKFLENKTTIDDVINQIKEDISMQDLTAIYELLEFIPNKNLLEYLNK
jgi:hypothetical protein